MNLREISIPAARDVNRMLRSRARWTVSCRTRKCILRLKLEQAQRKYHVIIVGGGPSESVAGLNLAAANLRSGRNTMQ